MSGHRARREATVAGIVLAMCTAAGCRDLLGIHVLDDTSSTDSGSTDGAEDHSASDAADGSASMPEAAPDVPETPDAPDAASEAGYCQSLSPMPTFCADFDEGSGPSAYWSAIQGPAGSVALTSLYSVSHPSSTLFQTSTYSAFAEDDSTTGGPGTYTFTFDLEIVEGNTSSSADMYVSEVDFGLWAIDVEITPVTGTPGKYAIDLFEVEQEPDGGGKAVTHATSGTLSTGTWAHVALTLTASDGGAGGMGSLSIDGGSVATFPVALVPWATPPSFQAGVVGNVGGDGFAWKLAVDDVTFDRR